MAHALLAILPPDTRAAFEFRHALLFDDDVYAARRALRKRRRGAAGMFHSLRLTQIVHWP
jgi:hypothetical protein